MSDAAFLNPLENPIFLPVLYRVVFVYLAGFFLIFVLNGFKVQGLWTKNIGQRYLSWLFIGPSYLFFVFLGGYFSLFFLLCILFLAIWEVKKISSLPQIYIFGFFFLALLSVFVVSCFPSLFYILPLFYFCTSTLLAIQENNAEKSFINASAFLFISIWIIFSLSHFVLLGHLNNTLDASKSLLIFLGFAVPLSDIFAYIVGRSFSKIPFLDRFKVASNLSSQKSYVGALGNILGASIGMGIMFFSLQEYLPLFHWIILSVLMGISGILGDITESMFKRFYKVKDSSNIIPGHGGVLDRIDSSLRVVIILYYYLLFVLY